MDKTAIVIGSGIVGLCSALRWFRMAGQCG
jgi:threonine dehydrogenase-like Zn-dependent dehydrogenase